MNLFDMNQLDWIAFKGSPAFDYPIDYKGALLSHRPDGHVDMLYYWEPDSYCHFHRHVAETTSTVLSGELYVEDYVDGKKVGERVRGPGDYAHKEPGDVHMERGGPEGALVLFNLFAVDGKLVEQLDDEGNVIGSISFDDLVSGRLAAAAKVV